MFCLHRNNRVFRSKISAKKKSRRKSNCQSNTSAKPHFDADLTHLRQTEVNSFQSRENLRVIRRHVVHASELFNIKKTRLSPA